ncbi:MAG: hypothetical protein MJK12_21050 [Colwellia sp.]|nr:hypothetical protein [Colwellia sp.]
MIDITAEFWPGPNGGLFRICRSPDKINGHILYVPPLFEDANRHRHVFTRSAISAYQLNFKSIIYDAIGTGDSQKNLVDVTLAMWHEELLAQIIQIRLTSDKPLVLCLPTSAVLLLTTEIINKVDVLQLWQPEFNGKRFVQQFKRLALTQDLSSIKTYSLPSDDTIIEIAGYRLQHQLLDELTTQSLKSIFSDVAAKVKCFHFELLSDGERELTLSRKNQFQKLSQLHLNTHLITVQDYKYWQASELIDPKEFLAISLKCLQEIIDEG